MRGRELHIGKRTRRLLVTTRATFVFKSWMPGNLGLREALVLHREPAVVATALAAMLLHEDQKTTPARVMAWIDEEPARYPEVDAVVILAAEDYFRDVGIIETPAGEAETTAPPTPSSTSGTSSSSTPAGTASPPEPPPI